LATSPGAVRAVALTTKELAAVNPRGELKGWVLAI